MNNICHKPLCEDQPKVDLMSNLVYIIFKNMLGDIVETTGLVVKDGEDYICIKSFNTLKGKDFNKLCYINYSEIRYIERFKVSRSTL